MIGIFLAAIVFVIVQMVNFFLSINSGSGQQRRDTAELKAKIAVHVSQLVPMSDSDMEELSTTMKGDTSIVGVSRINVGTFQSIFHEPLLAYAVKTYRFPADKRVLLISSSEDDFLYLSDAGRTTVYVNERELGVVKPNGDLFDPRGEKLLAHIEASPALSSHAVKINGREVGEIVNAKLNESPNPRAYQFLEPMNDSEADIFKALTFLSLAEESLS